VSKPAARITDPHVCPMVSGVVPHVGGPVLPPGEVQVLIAGLPAARVGDMAFCAGGPDVIAMGSFTVLIGGRPAARMGDQTAHGGTIVSGCPTVLIGDSGGGAGSPAGATMAGARASGAAFTRTDCAAEAAQSSSGAALAVPADDPTKTSWIELELVDDAGRPVPHLRYRVIPPDGKPREGFLDERGFARLGGLDPGSCRIYFPDLDGRAWEPKDGGPPGSVLPPGGGAAGEVPSIDPPSVVLRPLPVPPGPVPPPGPAPGPAVVREEVLPAPLAVYSQNTALLGDLTIPLIDWRISYKGPDRDQAMRSMIAFIRETTPDVVGLCELWKPDDQEFFRSELGSLYPMAVEGPVDTGDPQGSGLLLLSRHPVLEHHTTVFRMSTGLDGFAAKGAVHARIAPAGSPCPYDVFLTHTQSPYGDFDDLLKSSRFPPLQWQLKHLRAFVGSCRDDRFPAILMGDLNVAEFATSIDGVPTHEALYQPMRREFAPAEDLWRVRGDYLQGPEGITNDVHRGFEAKGDHPARPLNDSARYVQGDRLDYFFCWPGDLFRSDLETATMSVLPYELTPGTGIDVSDHYGIRSLQQRVIRTVFDGQFPIASLIVRLTRLWCLNETGGFVDERTGNDEVVLTFTARASTGEERQVTTPEMDDLTAGVERAIQAPAIELGDPGSFLDLRLSGAEIDTLGNDDLGTVTRRISRVELLAGSGRTVRRILPRLTGSDGEYAVEVEIDVR